jgi:GNAT superfamily N-acetyltransferase
VGAPFQRWWLTVRDGEGEVVSAVMRTAPFKPYPTFALPMPEEAARALAAALHERGEFLGGANGALPGSEVLARATAELAGGEVVVDKATRLWEATSVEVPPAPEGRLRRATEDDAELVLAWFTAFHEEADEQAGREPDPTGGEHNTLESVLVRIREGVEWLWELPDGTVAHLSGSGLPSYGVSRIGPVYTPKEHRGRGIASYVVGELTRRGLEAGHRMCLFTDRANPTSNKIYAGLGYEPVEEMAEHLVRV